MRVTVPVLALLTVGAPACGGGSGGDDGGADAGDTEGSELPPPPATGIPEVGMRRLSAFEYDQTLLSLLGDDAAGSALVLPADLPTPFDNDYPGQIPSRTLVEAAESLARDAVQRLLADEARLDTVVGCSPVAVVDDPCLDGFVRRFGRQALRRPLTDEEVAEYVDLGRTFATDQDDFHEGVAVIIRSLLQDIEFLYRVEVGEPVPDTPGVFRLSGYELATRMSYLIHGTTPTDALLDLAQTGELDTRDGAIAAAQSMLADPRARNQIDRFHAMWLGYNELQHAPQINQGMRVETRALIERVIFDDQSSWLDLLTSPETFVDDALAAHYGLPLPGSQVPVWVDYSAQGRKGLLSHGSFLSVAHDVGDTSPVRRGLHVLRRLTCQDVPPPPPDVVTDLPSLPGECKIDKLKAHAEGSCAGCHVRFDAIGFGLEQYDVAGRFRTHEDGKPQCPLDGEGDLFGVGAFNGPAELGQRLVDSGMLEACAVEHLYQYALGRKVAPDDQDLVDALAESFRDDGHHFDQLVIQLVSNDAFFFRRNEGEN